MMFDINQPRIERTFNKKFGIPVLHYPQLLGLAMGFPPEELWLNELRVKTFELLNRIQKSWQSFPLLRQTYFHSWFSHLHRQNLQDEGFFIANAAIFEGLLSFLGFLTWGVTSNSKTFVSYYRKRWRVLWRCFFSVCSFSLSSGRVNRPTIQFSTGSSWIITQV